MYQFHCSYSCRLSLLCGKYESNAVALTLALALTDRTIEAYDVLLALLETELASDENKQGMYSTKYYDHIICTSFVTPMQNYFLFEN